MNKDIRNISYVFTNPVTKLKDKYLNFLGVPLESMYEETGKFTYSLNSRLFKQHLDSIEEHFYEKGDIKNGDLSFNHLLDEITYVKKCLSERRDIQKVNLYLKKFVEDVAHHKLRCNVTKNQTQNSSSKITIKELNLYLNKTPDELYINLGKAIDSKSRKLFSLDISTKRIENKTPQVINLPEPKKELSEIKKTDYRFGKHLFRSIKRKIYDVICDSDDRVGKEILTKEIIIKRVTEALNKIGMFADNIIYSVIALVLVFSLDVFCKMTKPKEV